MSGIRALTPQPFPDIEEVARGNLETKQNQELQVIVKELQVAPLNKEGFTFFPVEQLSVGSITSSSQPFAFGFQEFKCKKDDIVLYQGMIQVAMPPGGYSNLKWIEKTPTVRPDKMIYWPEATFVYNSPVNPGPFVTTAPFIRYFQAGVDNPKCGYHVSVDTSSLGTVTVALLAAYYQVFR